MSIIWSKVVSLIYAKNFLGYPFDMQKLFFNGNQMESGKSLYDYNIQNGCVISLKVSNIKMKVNELGGETFELEVNLTDTLSILKARIEDKIGQRKKIIILYAI